MGVMGDRFRSGLRGMRGCVVCGWWWPSIVVDEGVPGEIDMVHVDLCWLEVCRGDMPLWDCLAVWLFVYEYFNGNFGGPEGEY